MCRITCMLCCPNMEFLGIVRNLFIDWDVDSRARRRIDAWNFWISVSFKRSKYSNIQNEFCMLGIFDRVQCMPNLFPFQIWNEFVLIAGKCGCIHSRRVRKHIDLIFQIEDINSLYILMLSVLPQRNAKLLENSTNPRIKNLLQIWTMKPIIWMKTVHLK